MGKWILNIVILIVGLLVGYFYADSQSGEEISALQAQVEEQKGAAEAATAQVQTLSEEVAAKTKMVEEQQAKIDELEAGTPEAMPASEDEATMEGEAATEGADDAATEGGADSGTTNN